MRFTRIRVFTSTDNVTRTRSFTCTRSYTLTRIALALGHAISLPLAVQLSPSALAWGIERMRVTCEHSQRYLRVLVSCLHSFVNLWLSGTVWISKKNWLLGAQILCTFLFKSINVWQKIIACILTLILREICMRVKISTFFATFSFAIIWCAHCPRKVRVCRVSQNQENEKQKGCQVQRTNKMRRPRKIEDLVL